MKYIRYIFIPFTVLAVTASSQVTVIENTGQQFTFSWDLNEIDTTSFTDGEKKFTTLSFRGSTTSLGGEGEFILPGYTLLAGVPPEGEISVNFTPLTTRSIRLTYPPATAKNPHGTLSFPSPVFNDQWISEAEYLFFRSLRTARMVIRPVQYDPATRTASVLTKAVCTIRFPNAAFRPRQFNSGSDFELMLRRLVVNYDIAQGWRKAPSFPKKRTSAPSYSLPDEGKTYRFRIGDGHDGFNEATIKENGLLKIPAKRIKELFGTVSASNVKLFAAHKGMLPDTLPSDGTIPDGVSEVPLLRIDHNGNGALDGDDCLIAYVTGASDWIQDKNNGKIRFNLDLYDDFRTYWLTVSPQTGLRIEKISGEHLQAQLETTVFTDRLQYRKSDLRRDHNPGNREWLWKVLSKRQQFFQQRFDLLGLVTSDTGTVEIFGDLRSGGEYSASFGGNQGDTGFCLKCREDLSFPITQWGDSTLYLRFTGDLKEGTGRYELSHVNITYKRVLEVADAPVVLSILPQSQDSGTVIAYNLTIKTSQKIYIVRVADDEQQIVLIDTVTIRSGSGSYRWIDTALYGRRYVVCNEAGLKQLPDVTEQVPPADGGSNVVRDLRSPNNRTGFLIITHPDFLSAADSLARHKARMGFVKPAVVDINDIYRLFSGGDKDAAAIRNFVGYVTRYWKDGDALDYLLLVGTGHYDAKNVATPYRDFIPVYIYIDLNIDNFFTKVSHLTKEPQLAVGRLACSTIEQVWAVVKKIVQFEDPREADMSEWRNRALFVADDDMQGNKEDPVAASMPHHISSDRTASIVDSLWPSMDIRKVYLFEYEWDAAYQKPGASRALINEINNGVGYINFFGHGADLTWTDEYILTQEMVAGMSNAKRYPVVSSFSCAVGRFDVPGSECLSGRIANAPDKGSIASISSTREAYATANEALAMVFYRSLFDSTGSRSIGMALLAGQISSFGDGHATYCILGDPSVRTVRHTHRIELAVDDSDDTLAAFQKVTVSGSVIKTGGAVADESFGGDEAYVALGLFNAPSIASRKDGGNRKDVRYSLPGMPIFLGKTPIVNGRFAQTVLIPQNITVDKPGVKLTAYAWNNSKEASATAGVGCRSDLIFHGTEQSAAINDTTGPRITIRPAYDNARLSGRDASFTDHITTQVPVKCEIGLYDESGIDAAGIGPDEGVTIAIEGIFARQNVNNKFQFKEGDFKRGIVSVTYEEDALKPGEYTMEVTARDLIGNLSKARFTLIVTEKDDLQLDHVLNFPNPVRMGKTTRFYCHSNFTSQQYYGTDLRITIKIYTLGGRLIRVIRNARNGEPWDCRDQQGALLSPDVYLYQIIAEDPSLRKTVKSKIMKLVILPPK